MDESKLIFSIAFAFVDGDVSPNVDSKNRIATYLKSMCVSLASVRRFYPETPIRVFTNLPISADFGAVLESLNVENRILPFTHIAPTGMLDRFQSAFYLLDVISNLEHEFTHALLDPDMVMVRKLSSDCEQTTQIMAMPMGYDLDADSNGLSIRQQIEWHKSHGVTEPHGKHYGGEFYIIPGSEISELSHYFAKAWQFSLSDFADGKPYAHTEEHIINYALNYFPITDASKTVARIWTTFKYRRIPVNYQDLSLWHLPAEKTDGFDRLFKTIRKPDSWFWTSDRDEFRRRMAKTMNLTQSNFVFRTAKFVKKLQTKFQGMR